MNNPLVTVAVVSYYSGDTILETLESIKNQTYNNIELIISDDCSGDDTVEICKRWLDNNKGRFVRVLLLTSEHNQGVCTNVNKAFSNANGTWIKGMSADDIMFPNCISDNVHFINQNKGVSFVTSYMSVYNETFEEKNCIDRYRATYDMSVYDQSVEVQLRAMAYYDYVQSPAYFYKKELFESVGGYKEKYLFEDWPFFLDVLEKGYRIYFLDKVTVGYRAHQSASREPDKIFKYSFLISTHKFVKERCFKYYSGRKIFATRLQWFIEWAMHALGMDKNNRFNKRIYGACCRICRKLGGRAF